MPRSAKTARASATSRWWLRRASARWGLVEPAAVLVAIEPFSLGSAGLQDAIDGAAAVPASCRWHVDSGIAHRAADGSPWCRIPHAA
ncbi:DUF6083 domain-containing protein, partial [Streptomyces sp. NPDC004726]